MKAVILVAGVMCASIAAGACSDGAPPSGNASRSPFSRTHVGGYYFDLGPSTIDVSAYPPKVQQGYRRFSVVCGSCHTTARPLNSPYATEVDWSDYVGRMRGRMSGMGIRFSKSDEARILEFLVFDSDARKVRAKDAFDREQQRLKALFAEREPQ